MHLITIRTQEAAIWMLPTREINNLIGGIVARYQEIFGVLIFAYTVLGNHYHMLVQAPNGHLDEFLENINREIARRINWRFNRQAKFWGRRYDDQVVMTSDDALEGFLYVVTNPTKHALAPHPKVWPGLSCYNQVLDGESRRYEFTHYSKISLGDTVKTEHKLVLSPLPQYAHLTLPEMRKILLKLINNRVRELREKRAKEGGEYASPSSLLRQKPGSIPKSVARSPRPPCYSKDPAVLREFKITAALIRKRYDEASFRYRKGEEEVHFPSFTFKPPLHRQPRIHPFGHLLVQKAA